MLCCVQQAPSISLLCFIFPSIYLPLAPSSLSVARLLASVSVWVQASLALITSLT